MSERIRIRGIVQGVGFRPMVARVARRHGIAGFVKNDGDGVLIAVNGTVEAREAFVRALATELPPLARIDSMERLASGTEAEVGTQTGFRIAPSEAGSVHTEIPIDAGVCPDCAREILDPYQRRYRYPFTTCTNCGPRYSIAVGVPFDRERTTMAAFPLCEECRAEYSSETDRRYHAQAVACYRCGPKANLTRADGRAFTVDRYSMLDAVDAVGSLLSLGEIVAIKGLGSYHLCCDATNEDAVRTLRERKRRPAKPFALMARQLDIIERYASLNSVERAALDDPSAPIVLLSARDEPRDGARPLAAAVAPGQRTVGFMRAYTPLHLLMLKRVDRPIVCTSGNRSDEPPCIANEEAKAQLSEIADWFLDHDRPIRNRVDDSVVRFAGGAMRAVRRARGLAPGAEPLPPGLAGAPPVVACGAQLKSTFALSADGRAIISPHLGDLDHLTAYEAYGQTYSLLTELYRHRPEAIVVDAHPEYRATQWGRQKAEAERLPLIEVQHHHAHVAAVMAEHGYPSDGDPVLGIAVDGLGYGERGSIWGGEFLLCRYDRYVRAGTFKPVAMLGGDLASRQPWRNLWSHLRAAMDMPELRMSFGDLPVVADLLARSTPLLEKVMADPALSPPASSGGRLFDAVSAALGICVEAQDYEGQAASELEACITPDDLAEAEAGERYPIGLPKHPTLGLPYLEFRGLWAAILGDLYAETRAGLVSARFHVALAEAMVRMADTIRRQEDNLSTVALCGGCFQNRQLLELTSTKLGQAGFRSLTPVRLPAHDGGIAFGQAAVAAAKLTR